MSTVTGRAALSAVPPSRYTTAAARSGDDFPLFSSSVTRPATRPWAIPRCTAVIQPTPTSSARSEEHTSELQSQSNLVCRLLLEKKYIHIRHVIAAFSIPHE